LREEVLSYLQDLFSLKSFLSTETAGNMVSLHYFLECQVSRPLLLLVVCVLPYLCAEANVLASLGCMCISGAKVVLKLDLLFNRPEQAITIQPEVLSVDKWEHFLDHDLGRMESKRMKSTLKGPEPEGMLSELEMKQLQYILRTAPMWDRYSKLAGSVFLFLSVQMGFRLCFEMGRDQ
jgi:hypothetical protein